MLAAQLTAEVKWFFKGRLTDNVAHWFETVMHNPQVQPKRVDFYIFNRETVSLGMKIRENRIEIKQCFCRDRDITFNKQVIGNIEHWKKWSFPLEKMPDTDTVLAPDWIPVEKQRKQCCFTLDRNTQAVTAVVPTFDLLQCCTVELTELLLFQDKWWSLGLEARGEEHDIRDLLVLVASHIFKSNKPPFLNSQNSYGYPQWLQIASARNYSSEF